MSLSYHIIGYSIAAFHPYASLGNVCAAERDQLLFVFLVVQEAAIPVTFCDWSTTIADYCPWIIPMPLMCENLNYIFLWVNIQYSVNVFDIWYVRLFIYVLVWVTPCTTMVTCLSRCIGAFIIGLTSYIAHILNHETLSYCHKQKKRYSIFTTRRSLFA